MTKEADPIDVYVGDRIRTRRKMLNIAQRELGEELGVTFQQIQKYERGANRIGSARLYRMANYLDVAVSYFFEGVEAAIGGPVDGESENIFELEETKAIVNAYYGITDPKLRYQLQSLARILSD